MYDGSYVWVRCVVQYMCKSWITRTSTEAKFMYISHASQSSNSSIIFPLIKHVLVVAGTTFNLSQAFSFNIYIWMDTICFLLAKGDDIVLSSLKHFMLTIRIKICFYHNFLEDMCDWIHLWETKEKEFKNVPVFILLLKNVSNFLFHYISMK